MIYIFHIFLAVNLFAAAFAGAINIKLSGKFRHLTFFYFGWSLTGQILALPFLILTIFSLFFALLSVQISLLIAMINIATFALFAKTLMRSWHGSHSLCDVVPDGQGPCFKRFLLAALFPFQLAKRDVKRLKNIPYGPGGKKNHLDIYMPKTETPLPMPVLIHVHGGAWVVGRKHQQAQPLIQHMASKGWIVVDINYRLGPRNKMPAMIEDVLRAIAWVKANIATYNGDSDFVALTGGSAGGHLVSLAALASDVESLKRGFEQADCAVDACVPIYGVYDFLHRNGIIGQKIDDLQSFLTKAVMPEPPQMNETLWNTLSPMAHVHKDGPPMLILHGRQDVLVDFDSAKAFAEILSQTSNTVVTFAELPGGQHGYDVTHAPPTQEHVRAIYRFLESIREANSN